MKILADENIPLAREAFSRLGEVETIAGRAITRARLSDVDVLMVRTVTRVDEALLADTPVRFVGTATAGLDHVDLEYVRRSGLGFADAAGGNATSVAEYVLAALAALSERFEMDLAGRTLGVIGYGHVGSMVAQKAPALGLRCVLNDPPLARHTPDSRFRPLEEALDCDIVTLHVPLEREGTDATYRLIGEGALSKMKPGAILINTARGGVVHEAALKPRVQDGALKACVLDVWENEPRPDPEMIALATIATPHIAGYSTDGRVAGTKMVLDAACELFGIEHDWDPAPLLPTPALPCAEIDSSKPCAIRNLVRDIYDIWAEDRWLREASLLDPDARAMAFDALRRDYPVRREFRNTVVTVRGSSPSISDTLAALGVIQDRASAAEDVR